MSTTFGIEIPKNKSIDGEEKVVEVAFRSNGIRWTNDLATFLPNNTPVVPLDNSAQGIYTIGDIRKNT